MPEEFPKLNLKKFNLKDIVHNATVLLLGRRRSGKCLKKGTNVLMYDGKTKKVEELENGDILMGDDSKPRIVSNVYSDTGPLFKVTHGKTEYTVNDQHILSLRCVKKIQLKKEKFIVTWFDKSILKCKSQSFDIKQEADEFNCNEFIDLPIQTFINLPKKYKKLLKGYKKVINFTLKELPVEPYILGCWLNTGDFPKKMPLNVMININTNNNNFNTQDGLPDIYKYNTLENRKRLLDGYLESNKYIKNEKIIDDFIWLCNSLMFNAEKIKHKSQNKWKLKIKKDKDQELEIQSVGVGVGEYYGFEVDQNRRFLLDSFIVTHNSYLVRDIFYNHQKIPKGLIFSGTEAANPFFGDFFPDTFIHSEYNPSLVETAMASNGKKVRAARQIYPDLNGLLPSNRFCIVLDDMLADANAWKKEKTIQEIFFNGRHFNIFFILTMQYPLGIPPALRSNIDYVFVFNEPSIKNRKKIWEDYCSMIPSFQMFENILDSCTQNYECLVVKLSGNTSDLRDQVFWYKAKPHTNFKAGHPKLWKYHYEQYNNKYTQEQDEDQIQLEKLQNKYGKSKKLKVIVNREGDIVDGYPESD